MDARLNLPITDWPDTWIDSAVLDANADLVRRVHEEAEAATALPDWWPWVAIPFAALVLLASHLWPLGWWA